MVENLMIVRAKKLTGKKNLQEHKISRYNPSNDPAVFLK